MERTGYWLHKWTDETSAFDHHGRWSGGLDCYERDYSMWIPDRIRPDDTVAVNDYIDKQFELSSEVADGLEVIEAADAQATIAALQAVIDDHNRLVREMDVRLNGEQGAAKQASLCDIVSQVQQIQAQLTQRTAELEAANQRVMDERNLSNSWMKKHDELLAKVHKAGQFGAVVVQDVLKERDTIQAELERVKGELVKATHNANVYQSLYSTGCMDRALLENELRDIRTLIAANKETKHDAI